ncbi:TrmH family RNA methyltransferase [Bacteroidota bacterium]
MYNITDINNKKGLLSYLGSFLSENRKKRFEKVLDYRTRHITVAIEDVYKDRNASAIVRTADCFGIQDVHIIENLNEYKLSSVAAKGSDKWINISVYDRDEHNTHSCLRKLKSRGYSIVATTPHKNDQLLDEIDVSQKMALIFGGEKDGLSELVMNEADSFLKIPMVGFTESFNISVASGIILHNITKKLRESDIPWQLTEQEKNVLRLDWTIKTVQNADQLIRRFVEMESVE